VVDSALAKGWGQTLTIGLFDLLGTPLAAEKRQFMAAVNTFLGIEHDLTDVPAGTVWFWPKPGLITKAIAMIDRAFTEDDLSPGQASKLRGVLGFLCQSFWGRVGRSAMGPLKQRQYSDVPPWRLSHSLRRALQFFKLLIAEKPRRSLKLHPSHLPPLLVASDAQADPGQLPTGGWLLADPASNLRVGGWCTLQQHQLDAWGFTAEKVSAGANCIAPCEAAMLPVALLHHLQTFRGRRVIWMVDNTTALYSAVKGGATDPAVDRAVAFVHFLAFRADIDIWWEYVDSKSNWADGISRDLGNCPWAASRGFITREYEVQPSIWDGELEAAWQLAKSVTE
jgi:hypothetical protein